MRQPRLGENSLVGAALRRVPRLGLVAIIGAAAGLTLGGTYLSWIALFGLLVSAGWWFARLLAKQATLRSRERAALVHERRRLERAITTRQLDDRERGGGPQAVAPSRTGCPPRRRRSWYRRRRLERYGRSTSGAGVSAEDGPRGVQEAYRQLGFASAIAWRTFTRFTRGRDVQAGRRK